MQSKKILLYNCFDCWVIIRFPLLVSNCIWLIFSLTKEVKTTTKLYFHSSNKEKYKGVIELRIDAFNLNEIYNYLFHAPYDGNKNLKNDIEEIFTYEKVIEYIWIVYIVLYSMYVVACEYKKSNFF